MKSIQPEQFTSHVITVVIKVIWAQIDGKFVVYSINKVLDSNILTKIPTYIILDRFSGADFPA